MELFLQNMQTAAQQVFILYIMVATGFICDRIGVFTEKTARACNDLMFYIVTPCVIVGSFLNTEFTPETGKSFAIAVACSFTAHFVGILLATPFFNKKGDENNPIYKFAAIYGNVGYMALPLANAVLGAQGVFYCSSGVIALNSIGFTHGVWLMNKGKDVKFDLKKLILNPGVISVLIGLPLFLLSVELPDLINMPINYISNLNTPLAMLIFGTYISKTELKTIFKLPQQYIVLAIRLFAVPLIMLGVCKLLSLDSALTTACMISAAAPSANNTVMFSAKYNKDTGVASKIVAFNSFVSIITLPVMIALSQL
ncbi:MAG: AEC family transporter [Clostridia bacterium]|nr:AEC family transporter [Clostridia bacterium]